MEIRPVKYFLHISYNGKSNKSLPIFTWKSDRIYISTCPFFRVINRLTSGIYIFVVFYIESRFFCRNAFLLSGYITNRACFSCIRKYIEIGKFRSIINLFKIDVSFTVCCNNIHPPMRKWRWEIGLFYTFEKGAYFCVETIGKIIDRCNLFSLILTCRIYILR